MKLHTTFIFLSFFSAIIFITCPFTARAQSKFVKTPADHEGPFYPLERQKDEDNNLLKVSGRNQKAQGTILKLSGRIIDETGRPFSNAVIEIWQTDSNGRYKDRRDRSAGRRNPDFQYWGKAVTAADGSYSFTTLFPGSYHPRPAHIHFKVWVDGTVRLTTQIYFQDTSMLSGDILDQQVTNDLLTAELKILQSGGYETYFQIVI